MVLEIALVHVQISASGEANPPPKLEAHEPIKSQPPDYVTQPALKCSGENKDSLALVRSERPRVAWS